MKIWVGLTVAFVAGAIPHIIADLQRQHCPRCYRGWAIWPIRNHLGRWVFVCRRDFKLQQQEKARIA